MLKVHRLLRETKIPGCLIPRNILDLHPCPFHVLEGPTMRVRMHPFSFRCTHCGGAFEAEEFLAYSRGDDQMAVAAAVRLGFVTQKERDDALQDLAWRRKFRLIWDMGARYFLSLYYNQKKFPELFGDIAILLEGDIPQLFPKLEVDARKENFKVRLAKDAWGNPCRLDFLHRTCRHVSFKQTASFKQTVSHHQGMLFSYPQYCHREEVDEVIVSNRVELCLATQGQMEQWSGKKLPLFHLLDGGKDRDEELPFSRVHFLLREPEDFVEALPLVGIPELIFYDQQFQAGAGFDLETLVKKHFAGRTTGEIGRILRPALGRNLRPSVRRRVVEAFAEALGKTALGLENEIGAVPSCCSYHYHQTEIFVGKEAYRQRWHTGQIHDISNFIVRVLAKDSGRWRLLLLVNDGSAGMEIEVTDRTMSKSNLLWQALQDASRKSGSTPPVMSPGHKKHLSQIIKTTHFENVT